MKHPLVTAPSVDAVTLDRETARLEALDDYQIWDTDSESVFDDLAKLAAQLCSTPIALICFGDRDRQWCKAQVGWPLAEAPSDFFCHQTMQQTKPLVVPNILVEQHFRPDQRAIAQSGMRFYAGVALRTAEGYPLGTLCVIDLVPRTLTAEQLEALQTLSRQVMAQLELRRQLAQRSSLASFAEPQSAEPQNQALLPRTGQQIAAEIQQKFGFLPPFFGPAQANAQVFESLWQQTWLVYATNPWSAIFKEKLSAYLSRFCAIPYCMICHSCALRPLGVEATAILKLLLSPPPTELEVDLHLQTLEAGREQLARSLSDLSPELETSLLRCAVFMFLQPEHAGYCRQELRDLLGLEMYQHLVAFLAYVKTCHMWMEAHPEVAYADDRRVQDHFRGLVEAAPELADFLEHYQERVRQEYQAWTAQQLAIAERKRYERAIQQAAQKLQEQAALLDVATDAIFLQDFDSQILVWNKGAEHLYGWTATQAIGCFANQLLTLEVSPQLELAWRQVMDAGHWQGELHQLTQTGQEVVVASRWTLVRDEQNRPKSILVVNTDITEKKQLETQFLRTQRLESIGTLAGGIAHDLNNVLAPILLSTQLLALTVVDERKQRLLNTIEVNAKRGADLVKQVLSFARGIQGERTLLQARHLILETAKISQETFPKAIEIYTDIPQALWTIAGDATQLHQVLMNLCVNARDAMPQGGTLSLVAENLLLSLSEVPIHPDAHAGAYIMISVTDTGVGIPAKLLDRIFEPFFTTKEPGKGTGLGLSTVMAIVKGHGGFVTVESQVNQGTEFKVYLPATEAQATAIATEDLELPAGHNELILVVDDEAAIREITKTSLEAFAYQVVTAQDGIEAISTYVQHPQAIKAVVIDMMMPVMDGLTTIRTLQKINPQVKVVAVSGLMEPDQLTRVASGVDAFLSKPFTAKQLLQTLDQLLHQ